MLACTDNLPSNPDSEGVDALLEWPVVKEKINPPNHSHLFEVLVDLNKDFITKTRSHTLPLSTAGYLDPITEKALD